MVPPPFLRLLGRPALLDPYGSPIRLKSQKQLALLAYLHLEGRGAALRRDRLADLLWPTASLPDARHSLVVALSALRARVDAKGFPADQAVVRMTAELGSDLHRLERGQVLATDTEPALELDAFLEELDIPGAPGFNHWRDERRARYWPLIEAALVRQLDQCRRTGDSVGLDDLADRILRHNRLSEAAIRARMEARAFAGDRIGALRTFEQWSQALHREVHAQPSEAMQRLARRLRRGTREGGGDGTRPRVPTEQWRDRAFIGRATEYRILYEAWERAAQVQPTHAFVLGESGIGKSTLLQRLQTAVSLDGAVTSRVQCYELERDIPYAALGALVRGLLERPEATGTSPQSLADLAQAVPAVREHFPSLPESLQLQGESFRIRVTDAMESLIRSISEETPVLLVVDDVHLIDDASASVLHLLARRFEQERVMLALAARPAAPQESPNFGKLRESHRRLGFVSVDVPPLADDESRAMLEGLLADAPDPGRAVREAMLRAAGGYPMALELFASEWNASGEDSLALAVPAMREELGKPRPPEDAYRMALDRICDSLDPTTRLVLQLAAVLGPRLNDLGMYQIISQGVGSTGPAMQTLQTLRLLRETEERLEFVNELIRGHAYVGMPSPLRLRLHAEVVERLLAEEARGRQAPGLEIAWHLIRAGRRDEATPYLLRGAREAMRGGAPYEAERGLYTALDRLKEPEKSEALLLIGEALQEQGRMAESVDYLQRVRADSPAKIVSRSSILQLYASFWDDRRTIERDRMIVKRLISAADASPDTSTKLRALWAAASLCREEIDALDVRSILDRLLSIRSAELPLEDRGEHALGKAFCLHGLGSVAESLEVIQGILGDMEAAGINNSVSRALLNGLAVMQAAEGRYEAASHSAKRGVLASRKAGDDKRARILTTNLALYFNRLGEPRAQLSWALETADRGFGPGEGPLEARCMLLLANAQFTLGMESDAEESLRRLNKLLANSTFPWLVQESGLHAADILLQAGRPVDATKCADLALMASGDTLLATSHAGRFARWMARRALESPDRVHATLGVLGELYQKKESLDRIDQAELLNSRAWLSAKTGTLAAADLEEMWRQLAQLPSNVTSELHRMGMLDF